MYKAYFHLKRNPFDLTPDPHCFVPTPGTMRRSLRSTMACAGIKDSLWLLAKWAPERPCCFAVFSLIGEQQGYCLRIFV